MNINDNLHWIFGGAGTGKSFFLSRFSKHFTDTGYEVVRLALTGVVSYNIHGETVDRFFGTTNDRDEINKVKLDNHVKLYKKTLFLIDEVSMMTKGMLESISTALIQATGRSRAFGGVAFILFGDLGQLLPVNSTDYISNSRLILQGYKYFLRKNIRQQDDLDFQAILNLVRLARVEDDDTIVRFITSRMKRVPASCVKLFTTRDMVSRGNRKALEDLPSELVRMDSIDYSKNNRNAINALNFESTMVERLYLKKGALVMVVRNLDVANGWSNGTLGVVLEIGDDWIQVENVENLSKKTIRRVYDYVPGTVYSRRQYPLILSYASAIHKVRSLTLSKVAIFFSDMPSSHGQLYVAMSRVQRAEDLYFFGVNPVDKDRRFRLHINCDAIQVCEDM